MQVSVRELRVSSDPDSSYFLRVSWRGRGLASGFTLLLTDGQDAWTGSVSAAAVCEEAAELEMQPQRYEDDLQQALTEPHAAAYSFSLTPAPPTRGAAVTLAYEKIQRDISFRLGSVSLQSVPDPSQAVRELLVHSLQRGQTLHVQNQKLQQENETLRTEQQRITAELKRYAGGKAALEAELYSRFVLVLNEKKAKIRSLQQDVTHLQEARSSEKQKESEGGAAQEEDEYGGSTDEEEQEEEQPAPTSSTSSSRERSAASPLVGGLSDITDVAPSRKRRFRHLVPPDAAAKRASPQRADPPAGSSKQQQQQQTPPQRSAAEVEDLFEDF